MNITNKHSNLTPQPRVDGRNGYANASGEKCSYYRDDKSRGLRECSLNHCTPYTPVSTAF